MWEVRLIDVLLRWLASGRFPREELRMRPSIALAGALTLLGLAVAFVIHTALT